MTDRLADIEKRLDAGPVPAPWRQLGELHLNVSEDDVRHLIERVKEAEKRANASDDWHRLSDEVYETQTRLRAAEEVVEASRSLSVKHHFGCPAEDFSGERCECNIRAFGKAIRSYDEAAGRVKE